MKKIIFACIFDIFSVHNKLIFAWFFIYNIFITLYYNTMIKKFILLSFLILLLLFNLQNSIAGNDLQDLKNEFNNIYETLDHKDKNEINEIKDIINNAVSNINNNRLQKIINRTQTAQENLNNMKLSDSDKKKVESFLIYMEYATLKRIQSISNSKSKIWKLFNEQKEDIINNDLDHISIDYLEDFFQEKYDALPEEKKEEFNKIQSSTEQILEDMNTNIFRNINSVDDIIRIKNITKNILNRKEEIKKITDSELEKEIESKITFQVIKKLENEWVNVNELLWLEEKQTLQQDETNHLEESIWELFNEQKEDIINNDSDYISIDYLKNFFQEKYDDLPENKKEKINKIQLSTKQILKNMDKSIFNNVKYVEDIVKIKETIIQDLLIKNIEVKKNWWYVTIEIIRKLEKKWINVDEIINSEDNKDKCQEWKIWNENENKCIYIRDECQEWKIWDENENKCIDIQDECEEWKIWDENENKCIDIQDECKERKIWDEDENVQANYEILSPSFKKVDTTKEEEPIQPYFHTNTEEGNDGGEYVLPSSQRRSFQKIKFYVPPSANTIYLRTHRLHPSHENNMAVAARLNEPPLTSFDDFKDDFFDINDTPTKNYQDLKDNDFLIRNRQSLVFPIINDRSSEVSENGDRIYLHFFDKDTGGSVDLLDFSVSYIVDTEQYQEMYNACIDIEDKCQEWEVWDEDENKCIDIEKIGLKIERKKSNSCDYSIWSSLQANQRYYESEKSKEYEIARTTDSVRFHWENPEEYDYIEIKKTGKDSWKNIWKKDYYEFTWLEEWESIRLEVRACLENNWNSICGETIVFRWTACIMLAWCKCGCWRVTTYERERTWTDQRACTFASFARRWWIQTSWPGQEYTTDDWIEKNCYEVEDPCSDWTIRKFNYTESVCDNKSWYFRCDWWCNEPREFYEIELDEDRNIVHTIKINDSRIWIAGMYTDFVKASAVCINEELDKNDCQEIDLIEIRDEIKEFFSPINNTYSDEQDVKFMPDWKCWTKQLTLSEPYVAPSNLYGLEEAEKSCAVLWTGWRLPTHWEMNELQDSIYWDWNWNSECSRSSVWWWCEWLGWSDEETSSSEDIISWIYKNPYGADADEYRKDVEEDDDALWWLVDFLPWFQNRARWAKDAFSLRKRSMLWTSTTYEEFNSICD